MYEINLVPDIKDQVIKAQRVRNFILFICIMVASAAAAVVVILFLIKGGQDITMTSQDKKLATMSAKIGDYGDLTEVLTLQGQLNKISEISENKKVFSRVFSIIGTILPTNADRITLSELRVNLGENTFEMKAQADAGELPDIDYRVLEEFKKSMLLMKFDYGRFVDKNDKEIPTRCIVEADSDGNMLKDSGGIYAYWKKDKKGCDPSASDDKDDDEEEEEEEEEFEGEELLEEEPTENVGEKIYRTPQFDEWYGNGKMTLEGEINGVPHFRSDCISYVGTGGTSVKDITWVANNKCDLTVDEGIVIADNSKNARDETQKLVLKFEATIYLNKDVLAFKNKHMMVVAFSGRQNVTDSYLQIGGMFAKEAKDCAPEDKDCTSNKGNAGE